MTTVMWNCRFQVDEVAVRGKLCQRVDLGNSMRVTIIDVTAVPLVQVILCMPALTVFDLHCTVLHVVLL